MAENSEQDVRQVRPDDADNRDAEVVDQDVAPDDEYVEEGPESEEYGEDEQEGDEPEDQDDFEDEPPAASDPRFEQLQNSMNQMENLVRQMANQQQQVPPMPQQRQQPYTAPTSIVPTKTAEQLDDMNNQELTDYAMAKRNEQVQRELGSLGDAVGQRFQLFGEQIMTMMDVLMGSNPEFEHLKNGLNIVSRSPGITLRDAYSQARSQAVGQENSQLRRQNNSDKKARRKRSRRAKSRSTPPKARRLKQKSPRFETTTEAVRAAAADIGLLPSP